MDIVKTDAVCAAAFELAKAHLLTSILNHSIRVFLYAASQSGPSRNLFVACIMHDFGTVDELCNGPCRFEVEGADRAVSLMESQSQPKEDCHEVWVAIALHTSPQIAERISELAKTVRLAVLRDFHQGLAIDEGLERTYPRLQIEKDLGDAVVRQCLLGDPKMKAPAASWPNNLYKSHTENPGWEGINKGF
ncbi:hypothetical protein FA10DRAFT_268285 [Acaromyces ingoldii]|uniref:HD domain-containing protein n=1 Tax=Acaromyces ingoldii TaxID=215250 RepID=A0A316YK21_9BASI|nr:hypothetical protein FA10DRAFT_268285 [Acaromyces ingoldii]PWN88065.1 hypothetical protein FA10DRAFT_268285 [Acaromyces ingoldii]